MATSDVEMEITESTETLDTGHTDPQIVSVKQESRENATPKNVLSNNPIEVSTIEQMEAEICTKEQELRTLYNKARAHHESHPTESGHEIIKYYTDMLELMTKKPKIGSENATINEENGNPKEVTLLLVGSAGNGKSATGNTILGRPAFQTTASTSTTISDFINQSTTIGELTVKVIDGPGVDTERSPDEILALSIESVQNALKLCDYKFSALLIVLKYGQRFTKQESEMIKIIKGILGENVFQKFGVCVITHGDNFQADFEDEEISFEDWCRQQQGEIKTLFQDCNNRHVLFNNRTKDPAVKEMQVNKLLEHVSVGHFYSQSDLNAAFKNLQKLMVETKAPKILQDTVAFVKEKRKLVEKTISVEDPEAKYAAYAHILNDVEFFEQSLMDTYGGPDNIKQPLMETKILRMELNTKMKKCDVKKLHHNEGSSDMEWSQTKSNDKDHYRGNSKKMKTSEDPLSVSTAKDVATKSSLEETDIDFPCEDDTNTEFNDKVANKSDKTVKKIIESVNIFRNQIEYLNIDQIDDKKIWTNLRSEFEKKEKVWKTQIVHLSKENRETVDVNIFSIKGMFSEFAPKDGNFIVDKAKSLLKWFKG